MDVRRAHVVIRGRVQGVGFRAWVCDQARAVGVDGWVRNVVDGGVEAVFEGSAAAVECVVQWCARGPTVARVDRVEVQWEEPTRCERGFTIR